MHLTFKYILYKYVRARAISSVSRRVKRSTKRVFFCILNISILSHTHNCDVRARENFINRTIVLSRGVRALYVKVFFRWHFFFFFLSLSTANTRYTRVPTLRPAVPAGRLGRAFLWQFLIPSKFYGVFFFPFHSTVSWPLKCDV